MALIVLSHTPTDEEILRAVSGWVELLSEERYEEAFEAVRRRSHWTARLMQIVITNYGDSSRDEPGAHRVTPPSAAKGDPTHEVDRFDGGRVKVWYDLPLDGEWSDLTALFDLTEEAAGRVLELDDLHIM